MAGRSLKTLVKEFMPEETRDSLNQAPWMRWVVVGLFLILAPLLIRHGWLGIRNRRIVSKGREYTGTAAIAVGALTLTAGLMLLAGAILASAHRL